MDDLEELVDRLVRMWRENPTKRYLVKTYFPELVVVLEALEEANKEIK